MAKKGTLHRGDIPNDPFDTLKRKSFLFAAPAGILSMLAIWGLEKKQNDISHLDFYALPILAIALLILFFMLWRHFIELRTFETVTYVIITLYAASKFYTAIETAIAINSRFSTNFILWIPIFYLIGFVVLDTRRAFIGSAALFTVTLAFGTRYLWHYSAMGEPPWNFSLLYQIYFSSAFYILLLYLMARLKERYLSAHARAEAMSELAMTDSLTQVDNRRLLDKLLKEEIGRAERHGFFLSIILMDLDNFKQINDTLGHAAGDSVLQEVARLLRQTTRAADYFGRWGGDEFLFLATNTDLQHATGLAERLRMIIQKGQLAGGGSVSASFGVTTYHAGDTAEVLLRRADLALYMAKGKGGNRIETVAPDTTLPALRRAVYGADTSPSEASTNKPRII